MSATEKLQAEITDLRAMVEAYRLRELEDLRTQLAEAKAAAAHYRAEAERNAEAGRALHREAQAEINRLRTKIEAGENLKNGRDRIGMPVAQGGG